MPHDIIMPALGMAQDTGLIVAWHKKTGDAVKATDILMEVETDKATMEVEAGHDGFVAAIHASQGDDVPVGTVIAIITETNDGVQATTPAPAPTAIPELKKDASGRSSAVTGQTDNEVEKSAMTATPNTSSRSQPACMDQQEQPDRILASPKAKRLARERGIDLRSAIKQGLKQPFHVADLDRILPQVAESVHAQQVTIAAEVPIGAFDEFVDWASGEIENFIATSLWLAFAAGSLRQVQGLGHTAPVTIAQNGNCYVNPDQMALSAIQAENNTATPDLTLQNLMGTRLRGVRISNGAPPDENACLTISKSLNGNALQLSLDFDPSVFAPETAIDFLDELAARAENPLRHLL
ncbi:biotin/lipoyl-containing protein [Thalassospira sp. MCCC 1A01428]|uniref:biotin/lipoyl-containing protein n=1 Tax=Thalassospira sp. MCCC 1A01428 TaxID=1470575 RepID=UPI000A1E7D8F|nr:biotin/lipoyl-containing protein [Thalassospira sp. MCCC 1A01428]